jgi:hypothetical protein
VALTTAGRDHIATTLIGSGVTAFNAANAFLGVGDSTTAFSAAQTDLVAATNKLRKGMAATFPTRATNVLTFETTFIEAQANFAWQEFGVFNAASAGTMLCRKVQSLGTKTSAEQWKLTYTATLVAS